MQKNLNTLGVGFPKTKALSAHVQTTHMPLSTPGIVVSNNNVCFGGKIIDEPGGRLWEMCETQPRLQRWWVAWQQLEPERSCSGPEAEVRSCVGSRGGGGEVAWSCGSPQKGNLGDREEASVSAVEEAM